MANYDFMPGLMQTYQNRNDPSQQVLTPRTPYVVNPNNPEQFIPDPSVKAGPMTWADIQQNYNPSGIPFDANAFNQIANNPTYTSMYGPAPVHGTDAEKRDYMTLLRAGGGMYSGTQTNAFGSFMGDNGWMLPIGAAAAAALATGGIGAAAGAAGSGGAEAGGAGFMGQPFGESGFLAGEGAGTSAGVSNPWGLSGLEGGGGSYASGAPMAEGGASSAELSGNSLWDTIKTGYNSLPPGSSNIVRGLVNSMTQDPNNPRGGGVDWGRLGTGILGNILNRMDANSAQNKMDAVMKSINQNQFPFAQYQGLAHDYMTDPAKRMSMLLSTPGYLESKAYADQAAHRRNARTGDLNSGYGDALRQEAIGRNASQWDQQLFGQLEKSSGMDFNNANAQAYAAANLLPWIYGTKSNNNMDLGTTISSSGILPYILRKLGIGGGNSTPIPGGDWTPGNDPIWTQTDWPGQTPDVQPDSIDFGFLDGFGFGGP